MAATLTTSTSSSQSKNLQNQNLASDSLKAAIFQRLHPRVYLERFLAENVRPDGRAIGTTEKDEDKEIWRDVSINVGSIKTADGSALVRMGGTTIVCGVKAEIAEPDLEKPNEGFLVPNIDLPAMCHPKFKPGPPSDEAQVLSEQLFQTLTSSNFISPGSLVIHPGRVVWTLYVDATCISYDGNVSDAALLAMVSALMDTQLPKAVYNEDTGQTICYCQPKSALDVTGLPTSISFGIFNSAHILADPTSFEEPLLDGTISVIVSSGSVSDSAAAGGSNSNLLSIAQQGLGLVNTPLSDNVLGVCIKAAKARHAALASVVREAIGFRVAREGQWFINRLLLTP